jgi:cystathionine gamma-synthase
MQEHGHVRVVSVDIVETNAVTQAMNEAVAQVGAARVVLWIETPTNPTLDEAELEILCRAANASNVKTVIDSTFASPIGQQPLKLGASVVMHSGTKFIGGHSDLMIGLALTHEAEIFEKLSRARVVQGATPGALEAFLALRGLRTLPLRYEAASRNADEICRRLQAHSAIEWAKNVGPMLSYIVKGGAQAADKVCASASMIITATSLGGVETTMERRQKYAGDAHVNPGLIRMSVGIEDVEDIWADLEKQPVVLLLTVCVEAWRLVSCTRVPTSLKICSIRRTACLLSSSRKIKRRRPVVLRQVLMGKPDTPAYLWRLLRQATSQIGKRCSTGHRQ